MLESKKADRQARGGRWKISPSRLPRLLWWSLLNLQSRHPCAASLRPEEVYLMAEGICDCKGIQICSFGFKCSLLSLRICLSTSVAG